jgi:hypothetical protein
LLTKIFGQTEGTSAPAIEAAAKGVKDDAYGVTKTMPVPGDALAQGAADARAQINQSGPVMQKAAPQSMGVLSRIENSLKPTDGATLTGQDAVDWLRSQRSNMSDDDFSNAITRLTKTGQINLPGKVPDQTVHDVLTHLDDLRDIQGPNAGAENPVAKIIETHLNNVLADSSGGDGSALEAIQNAKDAHATYATAKGLRTSLQGVDWGQSPGPWATNQALKYFNKEGGVPGMPQEPQYSALQAINDAATQHGMSSFGAERMLRPIVGAAGGYVGGWPGEALAEMGMQAAQPTIGRAISAAKQAQVKQAIGNAYQPLLQQQFTLPQNRDIGPALRMLIGAEQRREGW